MRIAILTLLCLVVTALTNAQTIPTQSIVYSARDPSAIHQYKPNPAAIRSMVNRLVLAVTAQPDLPRAWGSLVSPNDRIGIKISAAGGELFTTHRDIVNAIVDGLVAAGHSRKDIIVWDRSLDEIAAAGYRPDREGYQLKSIPPRDGYDPRAIFSVPLSGRLIWGDLEFRPERGQHPLLPEQEALSSDDSHFARILSSEVTKIINVPVMSDSPSCGIAGCLYNVTIPNIDNWRRFTQSRWGHSAIAEIYRMPIISSKVVLNIMDGLVAQYAGGPQAQPNFAVHYGTILASKDPVAIDALTVRQIEEWRSRARLAPITPLAQHVQFAGQMRIGNAEVFEVRNVGP